MNRFKKTITILSLISIVLFILFNHKTYYTEIDITQKIKKIRASALSEKNEIWNDIWGLQH